MTQIFTFILFVCFLICICAYAVRYIKFPRKKGSPPAQRRATLFDVKNFLLNGEKDRAIRVYRDIFRVTQAEAVKAVEELEKNLK